MTANSKDASRGRLQLACLSLIPCAVLAFARIAPANEAWEPKGELKAERTVICMPSKPDVGDLVQLKECSIPVVEGILEVPLLYGFKSNKGYPDPLSLVECHNSREKCALLNDQPGWALGPKRNDRELIAMPAKPPKSVLQAELQPTLREVEGWLQRRVVEFSTQFRSLELVWRMGSHGSATPLLMARQEELSQPGHAGCQGAVRPREIALGTCEQIDALKMTLWSGDQKLAVWRIQSSCVNPFPVSGIVTFESIGGGVSPSASLFKWSLNRLEPLSIKEDEPLPTNLRIDLDAFHVVTASQSFCARFVGDRAYLRPVGAAEDKPEPGARALYTTEIKLNWNNPMSFERAEQRKRPKGQVSEYQVAGEGERPWYDWILDENDEPSWAKGTIVVLCLAFAVFLILCRRALAHAIRERIGRARLRLWIKPKSRGAAVVLDQMQNPNAPDGPEVEQDFPYRERRPAERPPIEQRMDGRSDVQPEMELSGKSARLGGGRAAQRENSHDHLARDREKDPTALAPALQIGAEQRERADELADLILRVKALEHRLEGLSRRIIAPVNSNMMGSDATLVRRLEGDVQQLRDQAGVVSRSIHEIRDKLPSRLALLEQGFAGLDRRVEDMSRILDTIKAHLNRLGEPSSLVREQDLRKLLLQIVRSPPEGDDNLEHEKWLIWLSRVLPQPASTSIPRSDPLQVDVAWGATLDAWHDLCRFLAIARRYQCTLGVERERMDAWNRQAAIKISKEGEDLSRRQEAALETLDKVVTIDLALASQLAQALSGTHGTCPPSLLRAARDKWKYNWSNPEEMRDFVCDWVNQRVPYLQAALEGLPVELDLLGGDGACAREASERANASFFPSVNCGLAIPSGSVLLHQLIGNLVSTVGGDYYPIRVYQDQLGSKHVTELQRHSEIVSASPYSQLYHDLRANLASGTVLRVTTPALRFRGRNEPDRWSGGFQFLAGSRPKGEVPE